MWGHHHLWCDAAPPWRKHCFAMPAVECTFLHRTCGGAKWEGESSSTPVHVYVQQSAWRSMTMRRTAWHGSLVLLSLLHQNRFRLSLRMSVLLLQNQ